MQNRNLVLKIKFAMEDQEDLIQPGEVIYLPRRKLSAQLAELGDAINELYNNGTLQDRINYSDGEAETEEKLCSKGDVSMGKDTCQPLTEETDDSECKIADSGFQENRMLELMKNALLYCLEIFELIE